MRSIPWALLSVMGFATLCLVALSSGGREVEASSTAPDELLGTVERSLTKLVRPRECVGLPLLAIEPEADAPEELDHDRLPALVRSLSMDLAAEHYSSPYWSTRLEATARELGRDRVDELVALSYAPELSAAELATIGELLRVLRAEAREYLRQPSASVVDAARLALSPGTEPRALPFDVAARTLAAWGDPVDHALMLALAREELAGTNRGTLLTALGHSIAPEVALDLAAASEPEAMIGLSILAANGDWAVGQLDQEQVVRLLENRVVDAGATEALRNRALDALVAWSLDGSSEALLAVALNPETPRALARNAAVRLARGSEHDAALERALQLEGPRRLQLAEALASRAATTTDAGLRGVVLDVLCRATDQDQTPESRSRALHALAKLPDPVALQTVAESSRRDADPAVRAAAIVALRAFPPADAEPILAGAAQADASETVRRLAGHELGRHAKKE